VLWDLLRPRVIGLERFEQRGHRHPADCKLGGAVEELPARDVAMHVQMKQIQQLLWKIGGLLSLHALAPLKLKGRLYAVRDPLQCGSHGSWFPRFVVPARRGEVEEIRRRRAAPSKC